MVLLVAVKTAVTRLCKDPRRASSGWRAWVTTTPACYVSGYQHEGYGLAAHSVR